MKMQEEMKRKRHLEVLSITCTTVGVIIAVACFYGVPNNFGFKSPDVMFNCAFAFLLASVFLGTLAMISCIDGYEFLQLSVPIPKFRLFCRLLDLLQWPKSKNIRVSSNTDTEIVENQFPVPETSEKAPNSQAPTSSLEDSSTINPGGRDFPRVSLEQSFLMTNIPNGGSRLHDTETETSEAEENSQLTVMYTGDSLFLREYGLKAKPREQRSASLRRNNPQIKAKNVLQLKKRRNTILFGQLISTDSSGITRGPVDFSWEVGKSNENSSLGPFLQGNSMNKAEATEEQFYFQSPSVETSVRYPTGSDRYGVGNECFQAEANYNIHDRYLSFGRKFQVPQRDQVSDVILKLNEMNFAS